MREVVRFAKAEATPETAEVLRAQDLPEEDALSHRLRRLLDDAMRTYSRLAEPRAICEEAAAERFAAVLAPIVAEDSLVVGRVYPRAEALYLFVATVGEAVPARIRSLFDEDDPAQGWMLDAVASAGADLLAWRLAERYRRKLAEAGSANVRVLPYSPGYCGWPTRGQRPLFEALRPEEIGVTLNDSCLMSPIKSVSGVLVAGPGEAHRFRPDFPFCDDCRTRECGPRMASVLDGGPREDVRGEKE